MGIWTEGCATFVTEGTLPTCPVPSSVLVTRRSVNGGEVTTSLYRITVCVVLVQDLLSGHDLVDGPNLGTGRGVSPRTLELLRDTLERLVLFRNFDDPRSVPHDGNFASRAEICLARFFRLPTRDATLAAERFMRLATILPRISVRVLVHGQLASRSGTVTDDRGSVVECSRHRDTPLRGLTIPIGGITIGVSVIVTVGFGSVCAGPRAVGMSGFSVVILRSHFAMLAVYSRFASVRASP